MLAHPPYDGGPLTHYLNFLTQPYYQRCQRCFPLEFSFGHPELYCYGQEGIPPHIPSDINTLKIPPRHLDSYFVKRSFDQKANPKEP